jgi:hypothetical protein
MFVLLSVLSIGVLSTQPGCSDVFILEKNQISNYVRYSRSRGETHVSTPALNFALDLQKNGFGKILYGSDRVDGNLMLYAYKSSQNLHIYRICSNSMDESLMVGPILSGFEKIHLVGYKISINDINRLDKLLADNNFKLFGNDADALRVEVANERTERRRNKLLERVRMRAEEWEKRTFLSKAFNYVVYLMWGLIIISIFKCCC